MTMARLMLPVVSTLALLVSGCGDGGPSSSDATPAASASVEASAAAAPQSPPSSEPKAASVAVADTQPLSCAAQVGDAAARKLVAQCIAVSPATRPPCNAANSCAMIRNEVARGCAILGEDAAGTAECSGVDPIGKQAAADMVERYYDAINARDYASAWALWGPDGGASGKTLTAFQDGFVHTRRVHVDIGKVSDVEGGAGSLYVTVPVTIDAELDDGTRQRFTGSYALRQINRGMGISQGWHITTAKLRPA
ncbi:nuclear transport factor 2 family protein [Novosphingobium gossypii]|uniref:hypothetical protein n=1 Tax=Novosphingobium gossypii TaxID=1604774 RepID=UPI003D252A98